MEFQHSVLDLIKTRISSRTFKELAIEERTLEKLKSYIAELNGETKIKARFVLVNGDDAVLVQGKKLGTYGFIKGAGSFLVGVLDKAEPDALEFGYLFEKLILFATDLGLDSCWLGGTFKKSDFEKSLNLKDNEYIPIVSPVGYATEKRRILETAMRSFVGAANRKPWSELFFDGSIAKPLTEDKAAPFSSALEMVRLGPSASNKQPWRVLMDEKGFHFYICRTKGYGVPSYDVQLNDIGIAKCHFELCAKELELPGLWQKLENPVSVASWEYVCSWMS
ncbi:MAG: nitroreductase [Clostridia bacterium]|nr:nitroreductase [Clostridia bacterium]